MKGKVIVLAGLMLVTLASSALAFGKGTSMFAVQLTSGVADIGDSSGASPGYVTAYSHSELGVQGQYWYMMSGDYAVTLAGGVGFFSETDKPGTGAAAAAKDKKYSTSSFNLRIGGDRVAKVGDRAILYGGPGIEFWSGKAKYENFGLVTPPATDTYESQTTTRIGFSARLGGTMLLTETLGLTAHVGHRIGTASVEERGRKATWSPSSFDGAMGLVFVFGGD